MANKEPSPTPLEYVRRFVTNAFSGILTYVAVIALILGAFWIFGRLRSCNKQEGTRAVEEVGSGGYALGERVEDPTYHYSYQPLAGSVAASNYREGMLTYTSQDAGLTYIGFALRLEHPGDVEAEAARTAALFNAVVVQVNEEDFILKVEEVDDEGRLSYIRGIVADDGIYGLMIHYPADKANTLEPYVERIGSTLEAGSAG